LRATYPEDRKSRKQNKETTKGVTLRQELWRDRPVRKDDPIVRQSIRKKPPGEGIHIKKHVAEENEPSKRIAKSFVQEDSSGISSSPNVEASWGQS